MDNFNTVKQFKENAGLVSAIVHETPSLAAALEKAVEICRDKAPCPPFLSKENIPPTAPLKNSSVENGQALSRNKTIAVPGLSGKWIKFMEDLCHNKGIDLVQTSLRTHAGGMDMGITHADYAIADTGTLVINSDGEDKRLATMVVDVHVALLKKSCIYPTALDMAPELEEMTRSPNSYTAFITGASRTADIERVLAIGVHGPLELHIMLLED